MVVMAQPQQPQQLAIAQRPLQQPVAVQQQPQQPVADDWLVFVSKIWNGMEKHQSHFFKSTNSKEIDEYV